MTRTLRNTRRRHGERAVDSAYQSLYLQHELILTDTTNFSTRLLGFLSRPLIQDPVHVIPFAEVVLSRIAFRNNKNDRMELLLMFKEAAQAIKTRRRSSEEQRRHYRATMLEMGNRARTLKTIGDPLRLVRPSAELNEACDIIFEMEKESRPKPKPKPKPQRSRVRSRRKSKSTAPGNGS